MIIDDNNSPCVILVTEKSYATSRGKNKWPEKQQAMKTHK